MTRWGILSTARINRLVIAGARLSQDAQVVAVASRDRGRAETFAREHEIERTYGSYDELLADPDLDAVYIPLPNSLHVEWARRALQAGKHVLCEKPLSRREADVASLFDLAEQSDRLCMEAFMWRHHPQTRELARLVGDGAIGELRLVRAAFSFTLTDLADVRMRPEFDGGALMDVGCYTVSAARLLAGEPRRLTALQAVSPSGVDIRFVANLGFEGGVLASIVAALELPDRSELEAIGAEGTIEVSDPWHCRTPGLTLRRGREIERFDFEPADSYRLELDNLGAAIRGDAQLLLGRADAVGQARTIEALYSAAESGEAIELPPVKAQAVPGGR